MNAERPQRDRANDITVACAAIAVFGALFSGAEPTGTWWWDPILNAAFAVAVVVAATRATDRAVIVALAPITMLAGFTPWLAFAVAACASFAASSWFRQHRPLLQPVTGALIAIVLFRMVDLGVFGLSAAAAALAAAVLGVSALRSASQSTQVRARNAALAVAASSVAFLGLGAVQALRAQGPADAGVDAARAGLDAARAGDPQALAVQLEQAQEQLTTAAGRVSSPLLQPLYLLPVAAHHLRAVNVAADAGLAVANEALAASEAGAISELRMRQGQIDLGQVVAMEPGLRATAAAMSDAGQQLRRADSGWLVGPLDTQLASFRSEIDDALPEANLAAEAASVLPRMLGIEKPRRYLLLFGSPAEAREFGGFVGGYAVLGVDAGSLDLVAAGGITDLFEIANANEFANPNSYPAEYVAVDPPTFPQNLTSTPSIETIARATQEVFPELFGAPVDGVIYVDPFALAALTELTGPLAVEGVEGGLQGDQVVEFLFDTQYRLFPDRDERFAAMAELASAAARQMAELDLPGPERLGEVLGPMARAGRLQAITYDPAENTFLTNLLLQRHFVAPSTIDSFAVIHTNGSPSKLDLFLTRQVTYDVTVDGDQLRAVVDVLLESEIDDDAPLATFGETDGTNRVLLSLYSPHELEEVLVNGAPHRVVTHEEFGFNRYALFTIELPAGEQARVRFTLDGQAPPSPYRLGIWQQPTVTPDQVEVRYRDATGVEATAAQTLEQGWIFSPEVDMNGSN